MGVNAFSNFFSILGNIAAKAYEWMMAIEIGPLTLWNWILGFWGVSLIFIVIHFFAGLAGSGLSYGITKTVEAGRNHQKEDK